MTTEKRIKILTESEVQEFYSAPPFTANDQRFFFAFDDRERELCKKVRERRTRCMLALLLGYFKAKPVVLTPRYHQVKADLKYITQNGSVKTEPQRIKIVRRLRFLNGFKSHFAEFLKSRRKKFTALSRGFIGHIKKLAYLFKHMTKNHGAPTIFKSFHRIRP